MLGGRDFAHIPIIDVSDLIAVGRSPQAVAERLGEACRESGFFYVVGHGIDESLQRRLRELSREFFAQDLETKLTIRMALGGRAWRGYFRVGDELTSGKPDQKEGVYFGAELPADDSRVLAGTPLHGPNLFRIFNYPPPADPTLWGVGEHTDYGLLTILLQDDAGGLEVKSRSRWVPAPPIPGSFVCNIGDMLERMTAGRYRSTPHRVRNPAPRARLSFPFFFDPNFFAHVRPIELPGSGLPPDDSKQRWDQASVHAFEGTYGDYLLAKVGKVFPQLRAAVL